MYTHKNGQAATKSLEKQDSDTNVPEEIRQQVNELKNVQLKMLDVE
jgi:hypothetical protein